VDEVSCAEPLGLSWLFHAGGDLEPTPGGAVFSCAAARLRLSLHSPDSSGMRIERRVDQKLRYLELTSAAKQSRAVLVATLVPYRAGEEPEAPLVTVRGRGVEIAWKGRRLSLDVGARSPRAPKEVSR